MKYNKKWFIGKKKIDEEDGEDCVNFMARGKSNNTTSNFTWPKGEDVLWIKREDILCVIEPPRPDQQDPYDFPTVCCNCRIDRGKVSALGGRGLSSLAEAEFWLVIYVTVQSYYKTKDN